MAAVERLARQEQTGRSQQLWNEAHSEQPYRNLYHEQPDEGSYVESGIPTYKDQHSELDVQDQKEISDFSATGRWQTGHADARQSYDIRKRLIGCAGGRGGYNLCEKKNTETGGHFSIKIRKLGRVGV